ncbi:MAG: DUF433 domain-containing protein [Flavobacteriales bacterium]
MSTFTNKISLGQGIYTVSDIADLLNLPYYKVNRLLNEYWNKRLAKDKQPYSWTLNKSKAVNFHTLIEFFIFFQLKESGVTTTSILNAHKELSELFNTSHPFAEAKILSGISCFGSKIVFEYSKDQIINLDSSKQLNMNFIRNFIKKLDFENGNLAMRFYPEGKSSTIIVDPSHQFGQATIKGTNVFPETIFNLFQRKEKKKYIASSYGISLKQVNDAINYCSNVA